jgi:hypothetical protein
MCRPIPILIAVAVAALVVAGALASNPRQTCSGSCSYLAIVLNPPTVTPTTTATTLIVRSSRTYTRDTTRYVVGEVYNGRSSAVYRAAQSFQDSIDERAVYYCAL